VNESSHDAQSCLNEKKRKRSARATRTIKYEDKERAVREDGGSKDLSVLHDLLDRLRKRRVDEIPESVGGSRRLHHPTDRSKESLEG